MTPKDWIIQVVRLQEIVELLEEDSISQKTKDRGTTWMEDAIRGTSRSPKPRTFHNLDKSTLVLLLEQASDINRFAGSEMTRAEMC